MYSRYFLCIVYMNNYFDFFFFFSCFLVVFAFLVLLLYSLYMYVYIRYSFMFSFLHSYCPPIQFTENSYFVSFCCIVIGFFF